MIVDILVVLAKGRSKIHKQQEHSEKTLLHNELYVFFPHTTHNQPDINSKLIIIVHFELSFFLGKFWMNILSAQCK